MHLKRILDFRNNVPLFFPILSGNYQGVKPDKEFKTAGHYSVTPVYMFVGSK